MDPLLLIRYLKCSVSPQEEEAVKAWLADDPDGSHLEFYRQMHNIYNGFTLYRDTLSAPSVKAKKSKRLIFRLVNVAAVAALILATAIIARQVSVDRIAAMTETISVPAGKSMQLVMEDGSKIWLQGGTVIERPKIFKKKLRNITVKSGEVLLDVSKDKKRPFIVETFASKISVLGTKFNLAVSEERHEFSVVLLSGSIRAENNLKPNEEYVMKPYEKLTLTDNHLTLSSVSKIDDVVCWVDGLIDLTDMPFDVLMRKFETAFGIKIIIERDVLPRLTYTRGKIRVADGIEHGLKMLQLSSDFKYYRDYEANTIIIR